VKTNSHLSVRIALLIAILTLLLAQIACSGGGIIPNCDDVECWGAPGGCVLCRE